MANIIAGIHDVIGPAWLNPSTGLPQPNWNAAVITPSATPKDSRFMIDATSGMSRLRNTMASSRKASPTTMATNRGSLALRSWE